MRTPLKRITIQGFKSIRNLENFELRNLNVLIGANGVGKSNFLSLFHLMSAMTSRGGLKSSVLKTYSPDRYLFKGIKTTPKISIKTSFSCDVCCENGYDFDLMVNDECTYLLIGNEKVLYCYFPCYSQPFETNLGDNFSLDPLLLDRKDEPGHNGGKSVSSYVYEALSSWKIYHFHDTSPTSGMRRKNQYIPQKSDATLDSKGDNIASFLYFLREKHPKIYRKILKRVQLVLPFLEDFDVEPDSNDGIMLRWRQKNTENYEFIPGQLSDGGIRYVCLVTALLQPNLPSTLIIDEPELGLHPEAIRLLGELIKNVASRTQIIVATQSPLLLDAFEPEDVVVVSREEGESVFRRLDPEQLKEWLEEFTLGELWRRNIVEGGTTYE